MSHAILRFFENRSISITLFFFPILLVLLQTALWDWQSSKQLTRRSMFFGARVGPEFIASAHSDSILRRFRLRIWFLSLAVVLAYLLFFCRHSLERDFLAKSLLILFIAT